MGESSKRKIGVVGANFEFVLKIWVFSDDYCAGKRFSDNRLVITLILNVKNEILLDFVTLKFEITLFFTL